MFASRRPHRAPAGWPDNRERGGVPMKRRAVEWFVEGLRQRGVQWIATLCGHGLDPLFDAAQRAGLRLIDTRNEQTAGYIAEAYGRLSRRPGVCASSSGVAVANALTGVMNAWFDQAPMLYLSGSADRRVLGMGCFQDADQVRLARPLTKYSRMIDVPERVLQILADAWDAALNPPPGPVHVMFPMDVQRTEVDGRDLVTAVASKPTFQFGASAPAVVEAIASAARPVIIAGSGVYYSGEAEALMETAGRFAIPVLTPIWDRGICDRPHAAFLGVTGALSGDPGIVNEADLLVLAGAEGDYRLGYLNKAAKTVRADSGWRQIHEELAKAATPRFEQWLEQACTMRARFRETVTSLGAAQRLPARLHALDLIAAVEETLPPDGVLVIDGGSIGQWAHHLLCDRRYPSYWLSCGRGGVVGYGIGGAMAARLAFPNRPVLLLSGDGAFTFTVADLECAVRQQLPFTVLVADDQCWGITHAGHMQKYGTGMATKLGPIRFDLLAESLGARGLRLERAEQLAPALRSAFAEPVLTVIHAPISGGNPA